MKKKVTISSAVYGNIILPMILFLSAGLFLPSCFNDGFNAAIRNETENSQAPSPGNGGIVSASYIAPGKLEIRWQPASDAVTDSGSLQYRVFASATVFSTYDNALQSAQECTSGWSVGIQALQADVPGGLIWCNVFVRDSDGNISSYNGTAPLSYADLPPVPGSSGLIVFDAISSAGAGISWTAASDDYSNPADLLYRVFVSTTSDIATLSAALANASAREVTSGWTLSLNALPVSSLTAGTTWYGCVFVMDDNGGISAYGVGSFVTLQAGNPVPGNNGEVSITTEKNSSVLQWSAAVGDGVPSYRAFRTDGNAAVPLSTIDEAVSTGIELSAGWTEGLLSARADSLTPGKTYYFTVFARGASGQIISYTPASVSFASDTSPVLSQANITITEGTFPSYTLSWTAASDDYTQTEYLQYRVFMSQSSDIAALDTAVSNGTEISAGWTNNITSAATAITLRNRDWYFMVFVRDGSGNTVPYTMLGFFVPQSSSPSVGNAGMISPVAVSNTQKKLYWEKGIDDLTEQSMLLYKVYQASDKSYVETYSAAAASATALTTGWTADLGSLSVTVTSSSTAPVYFNVFVCDSEGGVSAYTPCAVSPSSSGSSPVAGGGLVAETKAAKKIGLSWLAATDAETDQSELLYTVYYSTVESDVATYVSALENGTLSMSWTAAVTEYEAKMPAKGVTYYLNVFVMDGDNNVSAYTGVSAVSGN